MPTFVAPRKSGVHRIAAIALFRRLLSQCKTAPIADEQSHALRNIVRNKFRNNVNLTSKRLLVAAFSAGYEALDHLHFATAGNKDNTSYILSLLSRIPPALKATPVRLPPPERKQPPPLASGWENSTLAIRPRPLSEIKGGIRRVPVLVSANKIPYLRTTKPQSPALSAYIKARIIQRQRRHDRKWVLADALQLAKWEDVWDMHVFEQKELAKEGRKGRDKRSGVKHAMSSATQKDQSWEREIQASVDAISKGLDNEAEKSRAWAEKMVDLIDRERELAEQERKERRMVKNKERREKKACHP